MNIAQVVPLRRFSVKHGWFDYLIPDGQVVVPGQLVEIPFLQKTLTGLVWKISSTSDQSRLKPIGSVIRPESILTDWQRRVIEIIADQTCSSLGHVLQAFVPTWPKRQVAIRKSLDGWQPGRLFDSPELAEFGTWYSNRAIAQPQALRWLQSSQPGIRVLLVPTIEDGLELQQQLAAQGGNVPLVSSQLTPAQYRKLYQDILTGSTRRLIGTGFAIGLPFPEQPEILIDQEEHAGYKLINQQPRFDAREVLRTLGYQAPITSPAPSLVWYQQHPAVPPPPIAPGGHEVWSLHDPHPTPWITQTALDRLSQATSTQPILIIAPQHGYASLMRCKGCGYVPSCTSCGSNVRLFASRGQLAVCRNCGAVQAERLGCPQCRGTAWSFSGLGVDRVRHMIQPLVPSALVGTPQDSQAAIAIGTYTDARQVSRRNWQLTILISGDAILNWPDFSAAERAWQFLSRLQAWQPTGTVAIQTFNPELLFWEAWRNSNHARWYSAEMQNRKRLGLPPFREHWVARRPTGGSGPTTAQVRIALQRLADPDIRVELASTGATHGRAMERLIISASGNPPLKQRLPWQELFPYPWQVDTKPHSWLLS